MSKDLCPVYTFRGYFSAPPRDAVVSIAPIEQVVTVYGGGGVAGERGLADAFGGVAVFKNNASDQYFAGVWGTRNASRFRSRLRAHFQIAIYKEVPDARLVFYEIRR